MTFEHRCASGRRTRRLLCLMMLGACGRQGHGPCEADLPQGRPAGSAENVMVVVLDDLGVDRVGAYGEHPDTPPTPTLDGLTDQGLLFRNAYTDPTCSPTRASLLTGRRPARHGVGHWIQVQYDAGLPNDEVTIPEILRDEAPQRWSTALIGKWHLSNREDPSAALAPNLQGFDHFAGTFGNPRDAVSDAPLPRSYRNWQRIENGQVEMSTDYLTTATTDDAIEQLQTLREPFYLQVAYHAVHEPWHVPPAHLYQSVVPDDPTLADLTDVMLEALDTELGRLLSHVDLETTTVIVLSDNGSKETVIREPWSVRGAKGSLYEAGVRVPMWALGAGVDAVGEETDAMVYAADIFATVADIAGVDTRALDNEIDGASFAPVLSEPGESWRKCLVVEKFPTNGRPNVKRTRAVRDDRFKLVEKQGQSSEMFDLWDVSDRGPDLLEGELSAAASRSRKELAGLLREDRREVK